MLLLDASGGKEVFCTFDLSFLFLRLFWFHSSEADVLLSLKCFPQCWESMVGQALYRLVFFDFLFLMLGSFFGEFLRKWVYCFFKANKVQPFFFLLQTEFIVSLLQPDWAKASAESGCCGVRCGSKCL